MNRSEKIAKIRVLAERGATEGEREAAREALRRMGEPLVDVADGSFEFKFRSPYPSPQMQTFLDMMINDFNQQFAGMTTSEILEELLRQTSTLRTPRHHGRVHYDPTD